MSKTVGKNAPNKEGLGKSTTKYILIAKKEVFYCEKNLFFPIGSYATT